MMAPVPTATGDRLIERPAPSVRAAVLPFSLAGLIALAVLALGGTYVLHAQSTGEAVRDARMVTEAIGRGVIAPNLNDGLLTGDSAAIADLDRVVRNNVLSNDIVRLRIWSLDGRIVYSDTSAMIGRQFELDDEIDEAVTSWETLASVSDLSRPENEFERPFGKLLEVYSPMKTPSGEVVVLELYQRYASVSAEGFQISTKFVPVLLLALVLQQVIQVPLAWSMARRLQEGQRAREALLRRAVEASDLERRRIARDVHDGIVQDLIGLSFNFAAAADSVDGDSATNRKLLRDAAARTRQAIRGLRGFLVDIYPPALKQTGLAGALSDLLEPLRAREIEVVLDVPEEIRLGDSAEALIYRASQEATRNVVRHAKASAVTVSLRSTDGRVILRVVDDGLGFDPGAVDEVGEGHFGMQILRDLARDSGGELRVQSSPGAGTTLELELPRL